MMTTTFRRTALTIIATALLTLPAPAAEVSGRIAGDGAKPVAHAVVRILAEAQAAWKPGKPVRVETGDDGRFVAAGLTGENFRIRVEAVGYAPLTQPGIPAGASVQLRLRRGGTLSGIVRDRVLQKPIGGATVFAWDKDAEAFGEDAYRKAASGKDGRFVVVDLPLGKATVEARAAGHAPAKSVNIAIPKTDLEILLDLPGGLTGLVTDAVGDPVVAADVKVSWRDATGPRSRAAKTGPDGRYRIADAATMPITRMTVKATKFLMAEREGPAPVDGVVDFVLARGGSITGIVRGYDGKFPETFRVKVSVKDRSSSKSTGDHEFSDPTGAFRVDDLDPGLYTIEAAAGRYARVVSSELDVAAEQVVDAGTLTLQSRSVLRGRVVAAREKTPVSGVTVSVALVVTPNHPALVGAKTSWTESSAADGTFATTELPEGTFDVTLVHPQYVPAHTQVSFRPDTDTPELALELYRGGALTGTVLGPGLDPIPGVHIVAAQATDGESRVADTGSDGRYYIEGLAPGSYTVTRQSERQQSAAAVDRKVATILEGETTTVDFDETPSVSVSGIVMRGDAPIPAAAIHFVPVDVDAPRAGASTRSDGDGGYRVGLRHGGRYQVSVVFGASGGANGHNVLTLTIPEQPEVRQDIVFNVQSISGHVVDPDRKGVKGALVTAIPDGAAAVGSALQSTTMTTDDGGFRLEAIEPATYRVTARARGYGQGELYPVVVNNDYTPVPDLELSLTRGWIMRGRLVDSEGRGVGSALVVVAPEGAAESGYLPAQTDGTGAFRITAPADAPVSVAAISPNFAPAVQTNVEPPSNGDAPEVVLHATPGGKVRVRVVHRSGGPAPGQQISYQPVPLFPGSDVVVERNRPRTTDQNGTTVISMLRPGSYVITVIGRRDATPGQVTVSEGADSDIVLEIP
jgi:hypothetical protein